VLAEQVVQPVTSGGGLADQVLVIEGLQVPPGGGQVDAIQGSGGVGADIRAGVQAEPAEQPPLPGGQVLVGQVERGGDREVLGVHQLQPVPGRGELGGQARGGPRRVMVELAGEHPHCQRQVPAQLGNLSDPAIPRPYIRAVGEANHEFTGLIRWQGVQADHRGVLQRHQPPPAGDQHEASGGAGSSGRTCSCPVASSRTSST
jgi:hypothetical protein